MCGLIGVAGDITIKLERTMRTLLILDSLRGDDSTGIAAVPRIGETIVAKELGGPFDLFDSKKFKSALTKSNRAIIGHNRFATSGGVSKSTAHPFDFDTLVGVHNGTLRNKWKLEDAKDFTVDSENLFHHIEKKGLRDALDTVDGAYALVWWDKLNDTLNFLRNKERPMWIAATKDGKALVWASEKWMMEVACSREGVDLAEIHSTTHDMHYSLYIPPSGEISKPKIVLQEAREIIVQNTPYYSIYVNGNKQKNS